MKPKDLACFNCKTCDIIKIPLVGADSEAAYRSMVRCKQKLSDHYEHILSLQHVCDYHSESQKALWKRNDSFCS